MRVKRIASLLLISLLMAGVASCAEHEPISPVPSDPPDEDVSILMDRQCTFADMVTSPLIDAGDKLYYIFSTSIYMSRQYMVYYSDKEHKEWLPLCFKPDCTHKGWGCDARLEGYGINSLWAYGDRLYYIVTAPNSSPQLWRMKLDGSDHELVLAFNFAKEVDIYNEYTWDFSFHNRYVYAWFCGSNPDLKNTERGFETFVFLVDLSLDEPEMKLTHYGWETGLPVCGHGNTVYCFNTPNNCSIYKLDLLRRSSKKLCELPFYPDSGLVLKDGRLYASDSVHEKQFVSIDAETGEITPIRTLEKNVRFKLTDDYLIGAGSVRTNLLDPESTPNGEGTLIYDYDGNLIQHIPYETYNVNILVYLSCGDYVFGYEAGDRDKANDTAPPEWYLDLREIGSPDMTWRRWEP